MRSLRLAAFAVLLATGFAAGAAAQLDDGAPPDYVAVKTYLDRDAYHAGDSAKLAIELKVVNGIHINTPTPTLDFQFPTSLEWTETAGLEPGDATWPQGAMKAFEFTEGHKIAVYEGTQRATLSVKVPAGLAAGAHVLHGKLKAQGCNHQTCFAPQTDEFDVVVRVVAANEPTAAVNEEKFGAILGAGTVETGESRLSSPPSGGERPAAPTETAQAEAPPESDDISASGDTQAEDSTEADRPEQAPVATVSQREDVAPQCPTDHAKGIGDRSLALIFLLTFGSGILLAFTPCVLPMVPITIGFFSRQQQGGKRPLVPALLYVLGIALVYSTLGTIAALSGGLFGAMLQNHWVVFAICLILLALSLSMFGLWDMNLPPAIANRLGGARAGNIGALAMGGTMGLVAAPCVGPFVVSLLTYVASLGSRMATAQAAFVGGALFFVLSLGMGLPFFLVALGAGSIRAGEWMVTVKKVFGFVILGVVLFFLRPIVGLMAFQWGLAVILVAAGIYFLVHSRSDQHGSKARVIVTAVGVAAMLGAVAWTAFVVRSMRPPEPSTIAIREFDAYTEEAMARAKADRRPVVIDFGAEWCTACKELEHLTFTDAKVQEKFVDFELLHVDMTNETPDLTALSKRYRVVGLPTIVFIAADGTEVQAMRVTGFEKAEKFLPRLDCVMSVAVASR